MHMLMILHKLLWTTLTWIGNRRLIGILRTLVLTYRDTIFYFNDNSNRSSSSTSNSNSCGGDEKLVVLTIDDGLSRYGSSTSMVTDVMQLLEKYKAHATFFVCSDYCIGDEIMKQATRDVVRVHGHELGNHMSKDVSNYYSKLNAQDFRNELEASNQILEELVNGDDNRHDKYKDGPCHIKWFRAPQGVLTSAMQQVLAERNGQSTDDPTNPNSKRMMHVLGDCYCDDWALAYRDPNFVYRTMMRQVHEGSILILHMPEKNTGREAILEVLERMLRDLHCQGYRCVSLSEMWKLRGNRHAHSPP